MGLRHTAAMATGRIKRRQRDAVLDALPAPQEGDPLCPLCGRPIPPSQRDAHHLVPRSRGGTQTQLLHRICHRQVHALFGETELAREYATADALLAHPDVARFVDWVRTKPPEFMERARKSSRRTGG
jgi:5-methylcytosine-specific restriction endonuclease McrA